MHSIIRLKKTPISLPNEKRMHFASVLRETNHHFIVIFPAVLREDNLLIPSIKNHHSIYEHVSCVDALYASYDVQIRRFA